MGRTLGVLMSLKSLFSKPLPNLFSFPSRRVATHIPNRRRRPRWPKKSKPHDSRPSITFEDTHLLQAQWARKIFPAEAAGVVEEVVTARRGIWEEQSGHKRRQAATESG